MKKNIIIVISVILLVILLGLILSNKGMDDSKIIENDYTHQNKYNENDISNRKQIKETIENITIKGIVELKNNGFIYIFNGQHFGEYGLEMEEYSTANIVDKKQECIDYCTSEKYDTTYIQDGDILICSGDLIKYKHATEDSSGFDTKDNPIIVLKRKDFETMKKETISNEELATVEDYYNITGEIYIKYDFSDKGYKLPFALKFKITDEIKLIGDLAKGKKIKMQYKDLSVPLNKLEIESIEVIDK